MAVYLDTTLVAQIQCAKDKLVSEVDKITKNSDTIQEYADSLPNPIIPEAPVNGKLHARKDEEWVELSSPDNTQWGTIGGDLTNQEDLKEVLDSKADKSEISTVGFSGRYSDLLGQPCIIEEAPVNGRQYVRQDGEWAEPIFPSLADNPIIRGRLELQNSSSVAFKTFHQTLTDGTYEAYNPQAFQGGRNWGFKVDQNGVYWHPKGESTNWQKVGIGTDLNRILAPDTVTITSSTGANTVIPSATNTRAGWMSADDKIKLDNLSEGGQGSVVSVFGRDGEVVAQAGDYNGELITMASTATNYTPTNATVTGHFGGISNALGVINTNISSTNGTLSTVQGNVTALQTSLGEVETSLTGKQDTLISGTNIKTINGTSILGEGNIVITGGGGSGGGGGDVASVFGRTGEVLAQSGDYSATLIPVEATPTNYTPTNSSVEGHLVGVNTKFNTIDTSLTNGGQRLTAAESAITTLENSVSSIEGDIDTVEGRLDTLESATVASTQVTAPTTATNYTPTVGTVQGHLEGIDTALANVGGGQTGIDESLPILDYNRSWREETVQIPSGDIQTFRNRRVSVNTQPTTVVDLTISTNFLSTWDAGDEFELLFPMTSWPDTGTGFRRILVLGLPTNSYPWSASAQSKRIFDRNVIPNFDLGGGGVVSTALAIRFKIITLGAIKFPKVESVIII